MSDETSAAQQYTDFSLTAIHHALRASRRRLVIMLVTRQATAIQNVSEENRLYEAEQVSVRRLAKKIVTIEKNIAPDHATGEPYHNVYTALIQTHLPELHEIDVVEYDESRKLVAPDRNLPAIAMVAAVSSPIARMLFHDAVVRTRDNSSPL